LENLPYWFRRTTRESVKTMRSMRSMDETAEMERPMAGHRRSTAGNYFCLCALGVLCGCYSVTAVSKELVCE
jgi:hypothetical protein